MDTKQDTSTEQLDKHLQAKFLVSCILATLIWIFTFSELYGVNTYHILLNSNIEFTHGFFGFLNAFQRVGLLSLVLVLPFSLGVALLTRSRHTAKLSAIHLLKRASFIIALAGVISIISFILNAAVYNLPYLFLIKHIDSAQHLKTLFLNLIKGYSINFYNTPTLLWILAASAQITFVLSIFMEMIVDTLKAEKSKQTEQVVFKRRQSKKERISTYFNKKILYYIEFSKGESV